MDEMPASVRTSVSVAITTRPESRVQSRAGTPRMTPRITDQQNRSPRIDSLGSPKSSIPSLFEVRPGSPKINNLELFSLDSPTSSPSTERRSDSITSTPLPAINTTPKKTKKKKDKGNP
eukprot:TRINITY_DN1257_c0_g1_i2.p1 TRINITY_DN1257_c0_g1~~TRINITY_DN1257_c0_g1_i2.p1  ORF type:complete len:119 (+),score=50.21 TRINITY_DN1257_c0_g1_i2:505-861(+)